jgi:hypothetical protein
MKTRTRSAYAEAYYEGRIARQSNLSPQDNPYPSLSALTRAGLNRSGWADLYTGWRAGWEEVQRVLEGYDF